MGICAQNRLGNLPDSLPFRMEDERVIWQTASRQTMADDVLAARTADRHERRQAGAWLLDILSQGPIAAQRLFEEMRRCGLAERTVRRAAAELGLRPKKDGKSGTWFWGQPTPGTATSPIAPAVPELPAAPNVAALPEVGSLATVEGDVLEDTEGATDERPADSRRGKRRGRFTPREMNLIDRTISICRDG